MTQQEKEILNQYASAKVSATEAKNVIDTLKDAVVDIMVKHTGGEKGDKLKTELGNFSIKKNRKYVYPDEVETQEEQLKEQIKSIKTESEQIGSGQYEEAVSLTFKAI